MAKDKSVAKVVRVKPVDQFPYVLMIAHGNPVRFKKMSEAKGRLLGMMVEHKKRCEMFDTALLPTWSKAVYEVDMWGDEGGSIETSADTYTPLMFRAAIIKEKS